MTRLTPWLASLSVALLFTFACYVLAQAGEAADLEALWYAAQSLARDRPDLVYPPDSAYFTMLPPTEWIDLHRQSGQTGLVFPYLYPPVWAWLLARLDGIVGLEAIAQLAHLANPLLLLGMLALARRLASPAMSLSAYWLLGGLVLLLTTVGAAAIGQSQPQILVAFLTLLAIERTEAGHPAQGGAALALAAAIKILPALFVLFWLAQGRWQAALWFAASGLALGLASVFCAGWPLHQDFLRMLAVISGTALVTPLNYSVESIIAGMAWPDHLVAVTSPIQEGTAGAGWLVYPKSGAFALVCRALQLGTIAGLIALFRRTHARPAPFIWPAAIILVALTGPIGWSYYHLAALAFLPALCQRLGLIGAIVCLGWICLGLFHYSGFLPGLMDLSRLQMVLLREGVPLATLLGLAFLFVANVFRRRTASPKA